jgi:hypothetical protein
MDLFLLSGTRLEGAPAGALNRLYENNRDGTFTDVTEKAGPLKAAVRPVVLRLCVPVLAASVVFVRRTGPRGIQPWVVPSSKSLDTTVCASAEWGLESPARPTATAARSGAMRAGLLAFTASGNTARELRMKAP